MNEIKIIVKGDEIRFIYKDGLLPLADQGKKTIRRASHVEPCDEGWQADMGPVDGPILGPFKTRSEALGAEVTWLLKNRIPVPA